MKITRMAAAAGLALAALTVSSAAIAAPYGQSDRHHRGYDRDHRGYDRDHRGYGRDHRGWNRYDNRRHHLKCRVVYRHHHRTKICYR